MPKGKPAKKTVAAKPAEAAGGNSLFERRPRNFGIGGDILPKRDLHRYVKWPKYVRLQRQRRVLMKRLKVPPSVNQFNQTLDTNTAKQAFRLLHKYRPEDKAQKKQRLRDLAAAKAQDKTATSPKVNTVKYGLNHITTLVEQKKAKLVLIAHDVDPIELVVWLPALCRKMDVPYCIVKSKSRLGQVVNKKNATALALTAVNKEDEASLAKLVEAVRTNYNGRFEEIRRSWGGGILSQRTNDALEKIEKARRKEEAARQG
jgi:large subunit ribosomal protein L7Ae